MNACIVCDTEEGYCEFCPRDPDGSYPARDRVEDIPSTEEPSMTTDHSKDIADLRRRAAAFRGPRNVQTTHSNDLECAAALLECHDETGISLDEWDGPRQFVEQYIGHPIQENGV